MLTLEDCIALSQLTAEEIDAIAAHDHLPAICAAELGRSLVESAGGCRAIGTFIRDDIAAARARGDVADAARLRLVLQLFLADHAGAFAAAAAPAGEGAAAASPRPRGGEG